MLPCETTIFFPTESKDIVCFVCVCFVCVCVFFFFVFFFFVFVFCHIVKARIYIFFFDDTKPRFFFK